MEQHSRSQRPQSLCIFRENQSLLLFKMYGSLQESIGSDTARLFFFFFCWSRLDKYFHECRPHKPAETVQVAVCSSTVHCAEQKNKAFLSCALLLVPPTYLSVSVSVSLSLSLSLPPFNSIPFKFPLLHGCHKNNIARTSRRSDTKWIHLTNSKKSVCTVLLKLALHVCLGVSVRVYSVKEQTEWKCLSLYTVHSQLPYHTTYVEAAAAELSFCFHFVSTSCYARRGLFWNAHSDSGEVWILHVNTILFHYSTILYLKQGQSCF